MKKLIVALAAVLALTLVALIANRIYNGVRGVDETFFAN